MELKQGLGSLLLYQALPPYFLDCGEVRGLGTGAREAGALGESSEDSGQ